MRRELSSFLSSGCLECECRWAAKVDFYDERGAMNRRDFLVRTGLALSAGMLIAPEEARRRSGAWDAGELSLGELNAGLLNFGVGKEPDQ